MKKEIEPETVEILANKLHEWYLEACRRPESGTDFNPSAQEPYESLKETQKFLDRYIASKILGTLLDDIIKKAYEAGRTSRQIKL